MDKLIDSIPPAIRLLVCAPAVLLAGGAGLFWLGMLAGVVDLPAGEVQDGSLSERGQIGIALALVLLALLLCGGCFAREWRW